MLKTVRNYKEIIKKETQEEKVLRERQEREELESQEWENQIKEFAEFLEKEVSKPRPFGFLVDMHKKLVIDGDLLTENMMKAIRKCMDRDKNKEEKLESYPTITLKIRAFLMKEMKLDSRIITGKVKAETAKAWLIEGHADIVENLSWCVRCGKELTEPASQITGMGAICAGKAGVPYDPMGIMSASKKEREKIRKQFKQVLSSQKFERWIPKSMAEVIEE